MTYAVKRGRHYLHAITTNGEYAVGNAKNYIAVWMFYPHGYDKKTATILAKQNKSNLEGMLNAESYHPHGSIDP